SGTVELIGSGYRRAAGPAASGGAARCGGGAPCGGAGSSSRTTAPAARPVAAPEPAAAGASPRATMPATSDSLTSRRNSASTKPTATTSTRYQNDGASALVNASITPVLRGSGRAWTAAGVRLEALPPEPAGAPANTPARLSAS